MKLTAIFRVEGLVSEVSHWTRKPIYVATREARRRRKVLLRQKNGYHKAIERKSTARYEIQNYEMPLESQAAGKVLNNSSRINSDTCIRWIKLNSGLCYCEVCKVTRWHAFNFPCSDWGLCTVEFKINKVFDFKINQKLCFLLINYNGNEPDFWWRAVEPI